MDIVIAGNAHVAYRDLDFERTKDLLPVPSLATGYSYADVHLVQCLRFAACHKLLGDIAEFGVYRGGTTELLARTARRLKLNAMVFAVDAFGASIDRASVFDLFDPTTLEASDVSSTLSRLSQFDNIEIVRGDIVETYRGIIGRPLVLSFFEHR